ncbi:hypothetical protein ABLE68_14350 [Nocardioides sp. CN2-186]|uniref:hypothetical protein n=1 Tax=Nocardioides tweenelious TaxID=3156607 RepID=UPI0032B424A2
MLVLLAAGAVVAFVWFASKLLVTLTNPNDRNSRPGAHVLRYHLVTGQDSPSVADAVRRAGYHATAEYDMGQVDLLVECTGDIEVEREKVRQAIAGAPGRDGGVRDFEIPPVRFVDELGADDPA